MSKFNNKARVKVLILISGSIAAVRIPLLVSKLIKENYDVKCVVTKNAEKLIQPISLSILSRNNCLTDADQWCHKRSKPLHITLCNWADLLLICPLTATTLSKWVTGNGEGLVSSILIANKKPIIVAPAMNTNMWLNQAVQNNYELIKTYKNVLLINPIEGLLACDQFGVGKMPPNNLIKLAIKFIVTTKESQFHDLANKSFLITGGSTSEQIDPARKITNNSSGMMSLVLAQVAKFRGAEVTYIHGPLNFNSSITDGLKNIEISNGEHLNQEVRKHIGNCDYFLMNAAVTDIKLNDCCKEKVPKKNLKEHFRENLEIVPDILGNIVNSKLNNQVFIGFCAFTGSVKDLRPVIKKKFKLKGCDLIFANPIDLIGQGFGEKAMNEGWLFDNDEMEFHIEKTSKIDLANKLINKIISINK